MKTTITDKLSFNIFIKQEIFDHLIYPLSIKLDDNSIIQLFRKLHIMSSIDYKITLEDWLSQSVSLLNGFTQKEAIILFNTYKVVSSEFETMVTTTINSNLEKNKVDVRYFGLFFASQVYIQKNRLVNIDILDKNAYSSVLQSNYLISPLSSPRTKQNSLRTSNIIDIGSMIGFIKQNIKLFLRLVATDIHNSETQLNSSEFNTLDFFFRLSFNQNQPKSKGQKQGLSTIAPFFSNFSSTTKVNIEKITEWICSYVNINTSESDNSILNIKNLSKCLSKIDNTQNKYIKIMNCEDSQIYIDESVSFIKVSNCNNCIIYIASVSKITSIENSKNCVFSFSSNFLKIGNCFDCKINFYSSQEAVLFGDNKNLTLGPFNVCYKGLYNKIKFNSDDKENNNNELNVISMSNMFQYPIIMHSHINVSSSNLNMSINQIKSTYEVESIKEFNQLITPYENISYINKKEIPEKEFFPFTPKTYVEAIVQKEKKMIEMKSKITSMKLNDQQEKVLHEAIQGHFKEWLISTGKIKHICDIIKVIDLNGS